MLGKKKKGLQVSIRNNTYTMLEQICDMHGRTKSEVIDIAIMTLYGAITQQIKIQENDEEKGE